MNSPLRLRPLLTTDGLQGLLSHRDSNESDAFFRAAHRRHAETLKEEEATRASISDLKVQIEQLKSSIAAGTANREDLLLQHNNIRLEAAKLKELVSTKLNKLHTEEMARDSLSLKIKELERENGLQLETRKSEWVFPRSCRWESEDAPEESMEFFENSLTFKPPF